MQCPGGMDYVALWKKSSQPPFSAGSVCRVIIPDGRNEVGSGWTHCSRVLEDKYLCFSIELMVRFFCLRVRYQCHVAVHSFTGEMESRFYFLACRRNRKEPKP